MFGLGKLLALPVRLVNLPLRVVDHMAGCVDTDVEVGIGTAGEIMAQALEDAGDEMMED